MAWVASALSLQERTSIVYIYRYVYICIYIKNHSYTNFVLTNNNNNNYDDDDDDASTAAVKWCRHVKLVMTVRRKVLKQTEQHYHVSQCKGEPLLINNFNKFLVLLVFFKSYQLLIHACYLHRFSQWKLCFSWATQAAIRWDIMLLVTSI